MHHRYYKNIPHLKTSNLFHNEVKALPSWLWYLHELIPPMKQDFNSLDCVLIRSLHYWRRSSGLRLGAA
jgi:hypothetical protein